MIKDLEFPKGKALKVAKGGPEALHKVLTLLSGKDFTGYLKIESKAGTGTGFVVLREGGQAMTLFQGAEGFFAGKDAFPRFKELAKEPDTLIEVHTDETLEPLLEHLQEEKGKKLPRGMGVLKRKLEEWKAKGYDVADLEAAMGQSLSKVIKAFADYKDEISKEEQRRVDDAAEAAERAVQEFQEKESPEPAPAAKRRKKKPRKRRGKKGKAAAPEKPSEGPEAAAVDADLGFRQELTFGTFIVGDANRFAHAAVSTLAEGSVEPYSPLFLVGGPGLGKTHLLNALGLQYLRSHPQARTRYVTAGQFREKVEAATTARKLSEFRQGFLEQDLLLLDDLQDLEGHRGVQEELFVLFEHFQLPGKPIALAGSRAPREMGGLDARLASRLESGLVADLQPPNANIRLTFLRRRIEDRGLSIPARVQKYLVDRYTLDLRELEGAVNRIVAYAATVDKSVNISLTKEALGEPAPAPTPRDDPALTFDLLPSRSYLIKEEQGELAYRLFAKRARTVKGLLITRANPSRVRETHNMNKAEILWLTDRSESSESTVGPVLERLMYKVERFMISGGQGVLLLDGIEYLKSNNGFEAVLKFLRRLVDDVSESEFTFLLALNPDTLEEREQRILENELEEYSTEPQV